MLQVSVLFITFAVNIDSEKHNNMKSILTILFTMIALLAPAQTYNQLWQKVDDAAKKDLPQSQLTVIRQIADKATKEKQYGQLLKAQLKEGAVLTSISPDSLKPALQRMEQTYNRVSDPALKAVYATAIGKLYQQNSSELSDGEPLSDINESNATDQSKSWFDKALADPALLASHKSNGYEPAMLKGEDSEMFNNDLLHVIGMETGHYNALTDYYSKQGNRTAACYAKVLLLQQQAQNGHPYNTAEIDTLLRTYGDLPVACELAILRLQAMKNEGATAEKQVAFINEALNKWGTWKCSNSLRNSLKLLEQPTYSLTFDRLVVPNKDITFKIRSIRNLNALSVRIYKVNVDGNTKLDPSVSSQYIQLQKLMDATPVATYSANYSGKAPWEVIKDSILVKGLPVGVYLVEAKTDNAEILPRRVLLRVSNVFVIHEALPNNKIRFAAVNATTGAPLPGTTIVITDNAYNEQYKTMKGTLTTDKNGEAIFSSKDRSYLSIYAYTATDKANAETALRDYYAYWKNTKAAYRIAAYTDRAIYRPGQTVHVAAVVWDAEKKSLSSKVREDEPLTFTLYDANYKEVTKKNATTDDFGTASVDFALPTQGLTGMFSVEVKTANNDRNATANFQVEEYKRPTFQVTFDKYKDTYQAGDTITLRGVATTYAGVPVQNAKVEYTVNRYEGLRWFWWGRRNQTKVATGSVTTADDGSFTVRVPMVYPEGLRINGSVYYDFDVNAKVTDMAGETHEGQTSLPLSNRKALLTSNLPGKSLRDSLQCVTFSYKNLLGEEVASTVKYRFDNGAWKTAKTNTEVEVTEKLASGEHHLEAVCGNDTLKQSFVVFTLQDKQPATTTHDWFYCSADQFPADGSPVYVQAGASDKGTQLYYSIFSANKELESGTKVIDNSVFTRTFKYDSSMGDGITVNVAWVVGGRLYTHKVQINRPVPDTKLNTEWKTFRDKLVPGQKETWTLRILSPLGKPAQAQLMATMYDKSLDAIYSQEWSLDNSFYFNIPSTAWNSSNLGSMWLSGSQAFNSLSYKNLSFTRFDSSLFNWYSFGRSIRIRGGLMRAAAPMVLMSKASVNAQESSKKLYDLVGSEDELKTSTESDSSTKGTDVQLRYNLTETAFFYPALATDKDGLVNISFTLPESVTTWKFIGLAHDKAMNYDIVNAEAVASKTVMVQPNMPRFLREGDKGQLSTRIFNTSDKAVSGTARLQIVEPESGKVLKEQSVPFSTVANGSTTASFDVDAAELLKLAGDKTLLAARITAEGNGFSDGEQNWLPILPDREYVTTTLPFYQHQSGTKTVDIDKLFPTDSKNRKLTVEYTANPSWLVLQAMPTMATPLSKDAASLAAAIYANVIGQKVLTSSPTIAKTVAQWKQEKGAETSLTSSLAKDSELKTLLLNETPWVTDAENETDRKQQLAGYLDANTLAYRRANYIKQLRALQKAVGSFSWWPGMEGSKYMTAYVVETLVRLNKIAGEQADLKYILSDAFKYLDGCMSTEVVELKKLEKKGVKNLTPSEAACHWLYASALAGRKRTSDMDYLVNLLDKSATQLTIYGKAGSAVILAQYGKMSHAKQYLESIRQYSVYTDEAGRYFDTPKAQYSWCDYRIPSQTFAIEALHLLEPQDTVTIRQMQQWLLHEKRTTSWSTSIDAVNAVYAFMLDGGNSRLENTTPNEAQNSSVNNNASVSMSLDGKALTLPTATAGLGYVKTSMSGDTADNAHSLTIDKKNNGTSWGAVYAQFTQNASKVQNAASGLSIKREIMGTDSKQKSSAWKVGDKVKVRITITADRDYDFVQVEDKRAACLEPVSQTSGYQWGYYLETKDNVTNYFFDHLSKGRHVVESEYYVDRTGDYTSGIATVQCAYSPEFNGREGGKTITVND